MITCGGRSSESGFQGAAAPTSGTLDPHGGARRATPLSVWHYGHTLLGTEPATGDSPEHRLNPKRHGDHTGQHPRGPEAALGKERCERPGAGEGRDDRDPRPRAALLRRPRLGEVHDREDDKLSLIH